MQVQFTILQFSKPSVDDYLALEKILSRGYGLDVSICIRWFIIFWFGTQFKFDTGSTRRLGKKIQRLRLNSLDHRSAGGMSIELDLK